MKDDTIYPVVAAAPIVELSNEASNLARIENAPKHPMDLFATFKSAVEPHVSFPNVMCIATVNK